MNRTWGLSIPRYPCRLLTPWGGFFCRGGPRPVRPCAIHNPRRTVGTYSRGGLFAKRRFGFPDLGTEIAHVVDPNCVRIELLPQEGVAEGPDAELDPFGALSVRGAKHIGFLVGDAEGVGEWMRELGTEPLAEPTVVEPAGVENCFVRDPDGTIVEFDQRLRRASE